MFKAESSQRPESLLRTITASLKHFCVAQFEFDPFDMDINRLVLALIKCETTKPRERTKVMPVKPFVDLFTSWDNNQQLSIHKLRQKAITLISLCAMCRPSDLAPKAIFRRNQITQKPDGNLIILLLE